MFFRCLLSCPSLANPSPIANPHLKLQIALTWTIDAITLLRNTIWLDTSALLDLDILRDYQESCTKYTLK